MSAVGVLVSFCEKHGPQSVLTTQAYGANASAAGAAEVPSVSTCDRDRDYSHSLAEQLEGTTLTLVAVLSITLQDSGTRPHPMLGWLREPAITSRLGTLHS